MPYLRTFLRMMIAVFLMFSAVQPAMPGPGQGTVVINN